MIDRIPTYENERERIPYEREVLSLFEEIIGREFDILRSLEDKKGLYMLEVRTVDEAGEVEQYNYIRAGRYPEGSSSETVIDVIFFSNGIPVGGHPVKKLKEGAWVDVP